MASIWTQGPGTPPKKLKGHLPSHAVPIELAKWVKRLASRNNAKIVQLDTPFEVHLKWPDGKIFAVWVEFLSPPSKPSRHEPRPAKGMIK